MVLMCLPSNALSQHLPSYLGFSLATSCKELTHWKRLWCWEGLGAGAEGDDRGWDGWMASQTRWTWVWVNSGRWWWTGRAGVLRFMDSQRVGHDWVTELNWTEWDLVFSFNNITVFRSHWICGQWGNLRIFYTNCYQVETYLLLLYFFIF